MKVWLLTISIFLMLLSGASAAQSNEASGLNYNHIDKQLGSIEAKVDSVIARPPLKDGPTIVGILGLVAGVVIAIVTQIIQNRRAREDRLETHLFDSLKWFDGGTQRRSIGLSIIEGNWRSSNTVKSTWRNILLNQAVYLIEVKPVKEQDEMSAHEKMNRSRICSLLQRINLDEIERERLAQAIEVHRASNGDLTTSELAQWQSILGTEP